MEVKCPTHPGAFTLESQLLDEAAPMASKSWQPSHEPHTERYAIFCYFANFVIVCISGHKWRHTEWKKGTHHTDIIYSGNRESFAHDVIS